MPARLGICVVLTALAVGSAAPASSAAAGLQWSPSSYNFGQVPYGSSKAHEVTLTNTGDTELVTEHWRSTWLAYWPKVPDPFGGSAAADCHILEPGESCSVEVVFNPLHPGPWKGWQKVRSQLEDEPWAELELRGEGTGPWVPLTPQRLAFGAVPVGTTTDPQVITLESQDREELKIEEIFPTPVGGLSFSSTPFRIVGGSCHEGDSLAPGQTCTIEVVMAPVEDGAFPAGLEIVDSAPDSPQSVELEGSATAAEGQAITSVPTVIRPPHSRRACAKGKHKVIRKGHRICVKKHRHRPGRR